MQNISFKAYSVDTLKELMIGLKPSDVERRTQGDLKARSIYKWLNGSRTPNLDQLAKLGKYFGVYFLQHIRHILANSTHGDSFSRCTSCVASCDRS